MTEKIALFPGSFDPITKGHASVIERAARLFDHLIIAVGTNADKNCMFTSDERLKMLSLVCRDMDHVSILPYQGLTVDFARREGATYLVRGLRSMIDFEFERTIAHSNQILSDELETVFFLTDPMQAFVTSSVVRDILRHHGSVEHFVPSVILPMLERKEGSLGGRHRQSHGAKSH